MKHDSGFTLIEVLVAIAIMALVLAGLTSMGVTTIQADTHSRRQSAAVSLAHTARYPPGLSRAAAGG